ncbi:MAG TPA: peptidoglycan binding domain-containing protein, partial [Coriobacteriia bacterium]
MRWLVGVPSTLLVLALLLVVTDLALAAGRIHPGVRVSGVAVGGLSREQAESRVTNEITARLGLPVTAKFEAKTWSVTADKVGVVVDAAASVERAWAVGREDALLTAVGRRFSALLGGVEVPAKVDPDLSKIAVLLEGIEKSVNVDARDATVKLDGLEPKLVPSSVGVQVDRKALQTALLAAFASEDRVVDVDVDLVPASVSDADAQGAIATARRMLAGPVTVQWEQKAWTFTPETLAKWLVFVQVPAGGPAAAGAEATSAAVATGVAAPTADTASASAVATGAPEPKPERMMLKASFSVEAIAPTLAQLTGIVGRPAVSAQFIADEGMVSIKPSQMGTGPDVAALASDLARTLAAADQPRQVTLRLASVEPSLTTEAARAMGIKERISKYTTTYASGAANRVNNIHVLGDALNNRLVPPGGIFDVNKAVGERTAAKGYLEAPGIV